MIEKFPLISVVIPVHNGEKYLAEAIESVLAQTYPSIEIIVIDDGSSDNSSAIAQQFSAIHYEYQAHTGAPAARNHGARLAHGEFLAFLDADDIWIKEKLSLQFAAIQKISDPSVVLCMVQQFHSPELDEKWKQKIACPPEPMAGHLPSAAFMKREIFFNVGQFDTSIEMGEFIDWSLKARSLKINMIMLREVLVHRRLHQTNKGILQRDALSDYARIIKQALDRRRSSEKQ